jgi:chemotaxis protein methyltransferase CheR
MFAKMPRDQALTRTQYFRILCHSMKMTVSVQALIMCRNVLIYFSPEYQRKLLWGFSAVQSKGSYLFLGHSETPDGLSKIYKRVANTVYERL